MAKKAKITHIITGAERDANGVGLRFDEATHDREHQAAQDAIAHSEQQLRYLADKRAKERAEAAKNARDTSNDRVYTRDASNDRVYGPGQPDGMGPKKWWQRG
jgi:hypothetical protein